MNVHGTRYNTYMKKSINDIKCVFCDDFAIARSMCGRCYKQYQLWSNDEYDERQIDNQRNGKYAIRYGLSISDIADMKFVLKNKCPICSKDFSKHKACVDHHHASDIVRGLLCSNCNTILGMANDDPMVLVNSVKYLLKPPFNIPIVKKSYTTKKVG